MSWELVWPFVAAMAAVVSVLLAIGTAVLRSHKSSMVDALNVHGTDITTLKATVTDFMPKSEIQAKIDHEASGRATLNQSMMMSFNKNSDDIRSAMVAIGMLQADHANFKGDVQEIKGLLGEQRRETKDGFAEVHKCLSEIARNTRT